LKKKQNTFQALSVGMTTSNDQKGAKTLADRVMNAKKEASVADTEIKTNKIKNWSHWKWIERKE